MRPKRIRGRFARRVLIDNLKPERALLTVVTEQAKVEHDTMATRIWELELLVATRNQKLKNIVQALCSYRGLVAVAEG